mmetsp:Transcript_7786/g.14376  ORF Transcript_7786/g.14376 Transcript_7786/m.14376 type:complete len:202 (+) Transcript_7786:2421-3026(+)
MIATSWRISSIPGVCFDLTVRISIFDLSIILIAYCPPVSSCVHKRTLPNVPFPISLPITNPFITRRPPLLVFATFVFSISTESPLAESVLIPRSLPNNEPVKEEFRIAEELLAQDTELPVESLLPDSNPSPNSVPVRDLFFRASRFDLRRRMTRSSEVRSLLKSLSCSISSLKASAFSSMQISCSDARTLASLGAPLRSAI